MSVSRINRIILSGALLSLAAAGSGCSSIDRLSQIGEKPKLTEIENPTTQPGYKPVQMPMPKPEQASYKANIANDTQRSRESKEDSGITDFLGSKLIKSPTTAVLPGKLLVAEGSNSYEGKGSVTRQEALQTNVAAVVTQVLPNGNLVVEGKQEIRVNFEIRELIVAGIVRPEDIQSDNTIDSSKIAQARIAYGGGAETTEMQQNRYGEQIFNVLLPF